MNNNIETNTKITKKNKTKILVGIFVMLFIVICCLGYYKFNKDSRHKIVDPAGISGDKTKENIIDNGVNNKINESEGSVVKNNGVILNNNENNESISNGEKGWDDDGLEIKVNKDNLTNEDILGNEVEDNEVAVSNNKIDESVVNSAVISGNKVNSEISESGGSAIGNNENDSDDNEIILDNIKDHELKEVDESAISKNKVDSIKPLSAKYKYNDLSHYIEDYATNAVYKEDYCTNAVHNKVFTFEPIKTLPVIKNILTPVDFNLMSLQRIYLNFQSETKGSRLYVESLPHVISLIKCSTQPTIRVFICINCRDVRSLKTFVKCGIDERIRILALSTNLSSKEIFSADYLFLNVYVSKSIDGGIHSYPGIHSSFWSPEENRVNLDYSRMEYFSRIKIKAIDFDSQVIPRIFCFEELGIRFIGHNSEYNKRDDSSSLSDKMLQKSQAKINLIGCKKRLAFSWED